MKAHLAWRSVTVLAAAALLSACATTQPVLYPADAAREQRSKADLTACRDRAERHVGLNARKGTEAAGRTGLLAATTAAIHSAVRGTRETANRALAAGVAGGVGSGVKTLLDWNQPDEVYEHYVERCMRERGHRVLGWR